MCFMWNKKDGGPYLRAYMYGFESKRLGSLLLLRFENGSREAYHSHAFDAISWLLRGTLIERLIGGHAVVHRSVCRIDTSRETCHKVTSIGRSWVLSLRGRWSDTWTEYVDGQEIVLTHGREVIA